MDSSDIELGAVGGDKNSAKEKNPSFGYVTEIKVPPNRGCDICGIKTLPYRAKHCKECGRCVAKFDHHCFWVGGCVGELNHGKFWLFCFFQALVFFNNLGVAIFANGNRQFDFPGDKKMQTHVSGIWILFIVIAILFVMLTGGLAGYHLYLLCTNQTTWEHQKRSSITYLKPYPRGLLPFYINIRSNFKNALFPPKQIT